MPSYQDIEQRLITVEERLEFILDHVRMQAAVTTGVLGPDGKPQAKFINASLRELYYLSKQVPVIHESEQNAPPTLAD